MTSAYLFSAYHALKKLFARVPPRALFAGFVFVLAACSEPSKPEDSGDLPSGVLGEPNSDFLAALKTVEQDGLTIYPIEVDQNVAAIIVALSHSHFEPVILAATF